MDAAGPVDATSAPTGPWKTGDGFPQAPTAIIGYVTRQEPTVHQPQGGPHFGIAGGPDFVDKRSWNKAAKLHPDEQMANCWAIRTLVTDAAWDEAERQSPTNLCDITGHLRLPLPAGIAWERLHRGHVQSHPITVPLDSDAREIFSRPVTGQGGHQSFFGRLRLRGGSLALTYDDFSYARERAAVVKGGWLARYQTVLAAVAPMLEGAGTTRALFKMRPDSDADSSN